MAAEGWERRVARPQHLADRLTPPPCCSWRGSGGTSGGRPCSLLSSASSPGGFCTLCPCTPSLCPSPAISWLPSSYFHLSPSPPRHGWCIERTSKVAIFMKAFFYWQKNAIWCCNPAQLSLGPHQFTFLSKFLICTDSPVYQRA